MWVSILTWIAAVLISVPAPDEVQVLLEFDGKAGEDELYEAVGPSTLETTRSLVRSGTASLRVDAAPPEKWPGLKLLPSVLATRGFRWLRIEIHSAEEKDSRIWVRIDDAESKDDQNRIRKRVPLVPGWNEVSFDLLDLATPSGRKLDGENLKLVYFYLNAPKSAYRFHFDRLRVERKEGTGPTDDGRSAIRTFEHRYPLGPPFEQKVDLIRSLNFVDQPERVQVLGKRILALEEDARLVEETAALLARTRNEKALAAMVEQVSHSESETLWRWCDVLGRTSSPTCRDALLSILRKSSSSADQSAALKALARVGDEELLPNLGADLGGSWQLKTVRIEALARMGMNGVPALTRYLKDESARVRSDANDALITLTGRDLGDDAAAWMRWYEANVGKPVTDSGAHRSGYGSYYGLPLHPGRIGFVIDTSGSMSAALTGKAKAYVEKARHLAGQAIETRLDLARAELLHALATLPKETYVQLVYFSSDVFVWSRGGPKRLEESVRHDVARKLKGLDAGRSTNLHGGLVRAFEPMDGVPFRELYRDSLDTVFLLSDGNPSSGAIVDRAHLLTDIRERNRVRRIKIHTIGIGDQLPDLLRRLAQDSGGRFVDLGAR